MTATVDWDRAEAFARGETLEANVAEKREVAYYLMCHGYRAAAIAQHVRCAEATVQAWGREWGLIGKPAPKSAPPSDTRAAPTWRPVCGTASGYSAHYRAGERYCDDCRAANTARKAAQRVRVHVESRRKR